jgi:pimeloyl-ACP methyl ester carboxylesterase
VKLPTSRVTLAGGESIRCARLGCGPPILLLHGYPDNLQIWSRCARVLGRRLEVIAIDWPGLGGSDPLPGVPTSVRMAEQLCSILDALQLPRATVFGFDLSGAVAPAFAARHPDRIERVIVCNALLDANAPTSVEIGLSWRLGAYKIWLRWLPRLVMRRVEATSLSAGIRLDEEIRSEIWSCFRRRSVREKLIEICSSYAAELARLPALYQEITCPALALWAGRGHHFPVAQAEAFVSSVPHARLEVIAEAGHWMIWERPDEVARAVLDILE